MLNSWTSGKSPKARITPAAQGLTLTAFMQLFLLRENGKGRGLGLDWSTRPSQLFVLQRPRLQPQPHLHLPVAPMPAGDNIHLNNGIRKLLSGRHRLQQLLIPQTIARRFLLNLLIFKRNSVGLRLGWPPIPPHSYAQDMVEKHKACTKT